MPHNTSSPSSASPRTVQADAIECRTLRIRDNSGRIRLELGMDDPTFGAPVPGVRVYDNHGRHRIELQLVDGGDGTEYLVLSLYNEDGVLAISLCIESDSAPRFVVNEAFGIDLAQWFDREKAQEQATNQQAVAAMLAMLATTQTPRRWAVA